MIESVYWKEDLLEHAKRLKPVEKPPRWSQKLVVNFEKELIISFFCIRKLIEDHKVSSKSRQYRADVFSYMPTGKKISKLNQWDIDEIYDLQKEKPVKKGIVFIANQLIHSCTLYAYRESDRNWGGVYACSDFERDKTVYRIPVQEIIRIFKLVGNDYPSLISMSWAEECGDFVVKTN
ncbi:MAG: hypothetical protein KA801_09325 [Syntrophorhabdaceae bacterium]|nr:hypothetical protein [Syntrophorhabdaceae bacterium]